MTKTPSRLRVATAGAALVAAVLLPAGASAWVSTLSVESGTPLRWLCTDTVSVRVNSKGDSRINDGSDVAAVKRSLATWDQAAAGCSYLRIKALPDSATATAEFIQKGENENVVVWVDKGWDHSAMAVAVTSVAFVDSKGHAQDGRILDADIEMNGQNFKFTTSGSALRMDIENTITHELGHVLGIDHPCDDGETSQTPLDHNGKEVPACTSAKVPAWMKATTMWFSADPGETNKRTLEPDDIAALCGIYPKGFDYNLACSKSSGGGCSVARRPGDGSEAPGGALWWAALVTLLLVARRKPPAR